jgi:hypothetical protein
MSTNKFTTFNFKSEPIWMIIFSLGTAGLGVLILLFAILLRKLSS